MENLDVLLERAKSVSGGKTVAVACPDDDHVLHAVSEADKYGLCRFILVGDSEGTERAAKESGIDISKFEMIDVRDKPEACYKAAELAANGRASCVMKGLIDTSVIMKAVLSKELGLRTGRRLTHVSMFSVPSYKKPLIVTDSGLNISPDLDTFYDIIGNAIHAARGFGIEKPKVALLAAKEKPDSKMPVTLVYREIIENPRGLDELAYIEGPLALDLAVSPESAKVKGVESPVAGDADILICPNIETGNVLYKSLNFLAGAECGSAVFGAKVPVALTSRADSVRSKLYSIAFALCNS